MKMRELVASIVAESKYAQRDINGIEYVMLSAFIDHKKGDSALSVENLKILVKGGEA